MAFPTSRLHPCVRGTGEVDFENDFPPGSDAMEGIRNGPKAVERMEFERLIGLPIM